MPTAFWVPSRTIIYIRISRKYIHNLLCKNTILDGLGPPALYIPPENRPKQRTCLFRSQTPRSLARRSQGARSRPTGATRAAGPGLAQTGRAARSADHGGRWHEACRARERTDRASGRGAAPGLHGRSGARRTEGRGAAGTRLAGNRTQGAPERSTAEDAHQPTPSHRSTQ